MELTRLELIEFIMICLFPFVLSVILHIVTVHFFKKQAKQTCNRLAKVLKFIYFTLSHFLETKEVDNEKILKVLKSIQEEIYCLETYQALKKERKEKHELKKKDS
jgi:hypothetical protein